MQDAAVLLRGGRELPFPGVVTGSSAATDWAGLPIVRRSFSERGAITDFELQDGCLALCVSGRAQVTLETRHEHRSFDFVPGKLSMGRPGYEFKQYAWSGEHEVILVHFSRPAPLGATDGTRVGAQLAVRNGFRDPQVQRLVRLMYDDVQAACPSGSLYGESLSLALIEYLGSRYRDADVRRSAAERMALNAVQLKSVREYVSTNLSGDLTVVEMAALLDLSPNHFTVLFRNATGRTPHQYVLAEHIVAGRRLIEAGRRSLAEIALALGFSSQSHFATSFRRATGLTPRKYQEHYSSRRREINDVAEQLS